MISAKHQQRLLTQNLKKTEEVAANGKGSPEDAINEEEVAAMSDKFVANEKSGEKSGEKGENKEERSIASEDGHGEKPAYRSRCKS